MVEEMRKRNPSDTVIKAKMDQTFPIRRREIVNSAPPVKDVKAHWPALFTEKQVNAEFNRITTTNLEGDFLEALDRYTPQLIKIFRSKKGSAGDKLRMIVQHMDSSINDITKLRTLVLQGISVLLGEDSSNFYLSCLNSEKDNSDRWRDVDVAILIVTEDGPTTSDNLHLNPLTASIILEGGIVMDGLKNLPQAMLLIFGLIYALHLDYPKTMKNTMSFIQRVMMGLGANKLPPKLQALKNRLLY